MYDDICKGGFPWNDPSRLGLMTLCHIRCNWRAREHDQFWASEEAKRRPFEEKIFRFLIGIGGLKIAN